MNTNRFETFLDAILAIIITILVLKLTQPVAPTLEAIWPLQTKFLTYLTVFLVIYNIWYNNHNLFQMVEEINNRVLLINGVSIFIISLFPYFATWVSLNPYSIPAQTTYGLIFVLLNILTYFSTIEVYKSNPYNKKLQALPPNKYLFAYLPLAIVFAGYILTYTVFVPGIYYSCLIMVITWIVAYRIKRPEMIMESERFEALIDAIVAIILTIIVLEIPMVAGGSWEGLFELKLEFLSYAISFIVCFNFWNYNNNLFQLVNFIDYKVIWSIGLSLFVLSLIPYLTQFVALNFTSLLPQALYGIDFLIVNLLSIWSSRALKASDPGNIALQIALQDYKPYILSGICMIIGFVIGILFYPPAIMIFCLISILVVWLVHHIHKPNVFN
ncbi:TMEM175 family protein [uncultured Methanobrevibacter sp.]|uniref:TMEM175 family protein n=1 Tax=uncultured Methanobrevibacter sp. TaxID=253161 RepID=UPI00262232D8